MYLTLNPGEQNARALCGKGNPVQVQADRPRLFCQPLLNPLRQRLHLHDYGVLRWRVHGVPPAPSQRDREQKCSHQKNYCKNGADIRNDAQAWSHP